MDQLSKMISLLTEILSEPEKRKRSVQIFQEEVWQGRAVFNEKWVEEMLSDLAYDLDYYESEPSRCQEDSTLYGDDKLEIEVRRVLAKMKEFSRL